MHPPQQEKESPRSRAIRLIKIANLVERSSSRRLNVFNDYDSEEEEGEEETKPSPKMAMTGVESSPRSSSSSESFGTGGEAAVEESYYDSYDVDGAGFPVVRENEGGDEEEENRDGGEEEEEGGVDMEEEKEILIVEEDSIVDFPVVEVENKKKVEKEEIEEVPSREESGIESFEDATEDITKDDVEDAVSAEVTPPSHSNESHHDGSQRVPSQDSIASLASGNSTSSSSKKERKKSSRSKKSSSSSNNPPDLKSLEAIYEDQLARARDALLQVRENAKLKQLKLESEHRSLQDERDRILDDINNMKKENRRIGMERNELKKERDEARSELGRLKSREEEEEGMVDGVDAKNRVKQRIKVLESERDSLKKENNLLLGLLGSCTCGLMTSNKSSKGDDGNGGSNSNNNDNGSTSSALSPVIFFKNAERRFSLRSNDNKRSNLPSSSSQSTWSSSMRLEEEVSPPTSPPSSPSSKPKIRNYSDRIKVEKVWKVSESDMSSSGSRKGSRKIKRSSSPSLVNSSQVSNDYNEVDNDHISDNVSTTSTTSNSTNGLWARTSSRVLLSLVDETDEPMDKRKISPRSSTGGGKKKSWDIMSTPEDEEVSLDRGALGAMEDFGENDSELYTSNGEDNGGLWSRTSSRLLMTLQEEAFAH